MANENVLKSAADLGIIGKSGASILRVADLSRGGQLGVGFDARYIDSATPLVLRPSVIVVLKTPKMYDKVNKSFGQMLKAVIETQAKSVQGIDFGYNLETDDSAPAGHDGQVISVALQTKRSPVNPSMTFNDVRGGLIGRMFRTWVFDMQHPDTNASMQHLGTFSSAEKAWVISEYSMTMMAIMYDETMDPENIIEAAIYTNMFPRDPGGPIGFGREIGQSRVIERTVEFTGIVQHNDTIRELAIDYAKTAKLAQAKFSSEAANIKARTAAAEKVSTELAAFGIAEEAKGAIAS